MEVSSGLSQWATFFTTSVKAPLAPVSTVVFLLSCLFVVACGLSNLFPTSHSKYITEFGASSDKFYLRFLVWSFFGLVGAGLPSTVFCTLSLKASHIAPSALVASAGLLTMGAGATVVFAGVDSSSGEPAPPALSVGPVSPPLRYPSLQGPALPWYLAGSSLLVLGIVFISAAIYSAWRQIGNRSQLESFRKSSLLRVSTEIAVTTSAGVTVATCASIGTTLIVHCAALAAFQERTFLGGILPVLAGAVAAVACEGLCRLAAVAAAGSAAAPVIARSSCSSAVNTFGQPSASVLRHPSSDLSPRGHPTAAGRMRSMRQQQRYASSWAASGRAVTSLGGTAFVAGIVSAAARIGAPLSRCSPFLAAAGADPLLFVSVATGAPSLSAAVYLTQEILAEASLERAGLAAPEASHQPPNAPIRPRVSASTLCAHGLGVAPMTLQWVSTLSGALASAGIDYVWQYQNPSVGFGLLIGALTGFFVGRTVSGMMCAAAVAIAVVAGKDPPSAEEEFPDVCSKARIPPRTDVEESELCV
eukprot:TRINITY_DN58830_c0_g1_i1.p1 TRINITY_DN58830_c0_g1~~TRINITY_DN58830_c0_g1_i1.p1  ORF type:complete len:531 (+),score=31.98 TRINITY_DN58830_c0_g1_i1:48-1640(+)